MFCPVICCSTLDNTSIQCLHRKVPASKIGSMKRISSKAWNKLFSKVFTHVWNLAIMREVFVMVLSYFSFVEFFSWHSYIYLIYCLFGTLHKFWLAILVVNDFNLFEFIQVVNFCMPVCYCAFVCESCLATSSSPTPPTPAIFFFL